MARTITEILDAMITEKETRTELDNLQPKPDTSQTFLDDLTTTSKVAIWRLMFFVLAVAIFLHEKIFDLHEADVQAQAKVLIPGTTRHLRQLALDFQFGDVLQFIDEIFQYATIDEAKQIVKRAAVIEVGGQVILKVAKLTALVPDKLDSGELTAFQSYIGQVKTAGIQIIIITADADLLKIAYDIHFNPQLIQNTGESIGTPGTFPVEDAINNFIQDLPFNGILNLTQLTDAIQLAEGVNDPIITLAEAKIPGGVFATIVNEYIPNAGHLKIDPAFPLSTQLTYIADVV